MLRIFLSKCKIRLKSINKEILVYVPFYLYIKVKKKINSRIILIFNLSFFETLNSIAFYEHQGKEGLKNTNNLIIIYSNHDKKIQN